MCLKSKTIDRCNRNKFHKKDSIVCENAINVVITLKIKIVIFVIELIYNLKIERKLKFCDSKMHEMS